MTDAIRRRVIVSGRVQGVWFRNTTLDTALAVGAAGWVRNLPDGTVEAVFEGPQSTVEEMLAWSRKGPPRAHVDSLEVVEEQVEGLTEFEIR